MNIQTSVRADKAELQRLAREEAYSTPLKDFHPGAPKLFQDDTLWPWFERLRKEEPVHYCTNAPIEPYWSVTRYNDIMHVDTNHGIFSSDVTLGGISIRDVPPGYDYPSFIAMDQPRHSAQRKTVSPMFTPTHLDELAILIRKRTGRVLDALPRNETFNFVDRVSIELTTQMLATLFDFPFEERRKLTRWSDVSTALVDTELGGKKIKKGDRVVMWYISGNRDEEAIEKPDEFIIDRPRPRTHLSFGFGIHRCVGMRLAELQLKIVWQEMLKRFERIEVVGEPKRVYSSFVRGIESLPVRIPT